MQPSRKRWLSIPTKTSCAPPSVTGIERDRLTAVLQSGESVPLTAGAALSDKNARAQRIAWAP